MAAILVGLCRRDPPSQLDDWTGEIIQSARHGAYLSNPQLIYRRRHRRTAGTADRPIAGKCAASMMPALPKD
ncbi:MAG: hypothetical protein ACLTGJ_08840 [Faecalibacterium prausnitzii]